MGKIKRIIVLAVVGIVSFVVGTLVMQLILELFDQVNKMNKLYQLFKQYKYKLTLIYVFMLLTEILKYI